MDKKLWVLIALILAVVAAVVAWAAAGKPKVDDLR